MTGMSITKELSANDTGETGGHQAGILVPRKKELLAFFPALDGDQRNPRAHIHFRDEADTVWEFAFIYYNNKKFGGTRNEYRLTRMTRYIREAGLIEGDSVIFTRGTAGDYRIAHCRKSQASLVDGKVLRLGSGWRVINV